jgi:starch-binding outer membrane protein, SusD/RagB family
MTSPRRLAVATLAGALALVVGASACSEDLVENPKNIIVADNLYTNLTGFEAGLNALYFQARRERFGLDNTSNDILSTGMTIGVDNGFGNYLSPTERLFSEFGVRNQPQDGYITQIWNWNYQTINAANTIIGRAENPDVQWSAADKARVIAEARLIRAWAYRHLTYMYGDVPINTVESTGENIRTDWERIPRDSVRHFIVNDLLFAEANLPATSTNPGKLTRAVAQHYLAEMYLALGKPDSAELKAQAVVSSADYRLVTARYGVQATRPGTAFTDMFLDGNVNRSQGNTEVLWAWQYAENVLGGGGSIMRRSWVTRYESNAGLKISGEYGGRGIGRLAITNYGLNLYEAADVRGGNFAIRRFYTLNNPATLGTTRKLGDTLRTVAGTEKVSDPLRPSTRKWDWVDPVDTTGAIQYNDQPYLRLAETYLLLAEAQFKLGKTPEAAATLNAVRARSGASAITAAQVTLAFILDERSRELVTEEERRYTLLRTGTWLARVKQYNTLAAPVVAARDTLLPIPQSAIDANINRPLPQNPGF